MPRRDRTGPQGRGPMTGKGRGRCNPEDGLTRPQGQGGIGSGRGKGRGSGSGAGWANGKGRGAGQGRDKRS